MKKILIFYGAYGGGHLSAARAIKNYLDTNYPECETLMVDCVEYINKYLNKVSTAAYKEMAKKAPWMWKKFIITLNMALLLEFLLLLISLCLEN